jgi:beta-galactosidase
MFEWTTWGDILDGGPGTTTLARYADQFYSGQAAATYRKLGKGSVMYIGVDTIDGKMEEGLLRKLYADAGAQPASLPPDLVVDWRDGFWVATNFTSENQAIPAGPNAKILSGTRNLGPGRAAIWVE